MLPSSSDRTARHPPSTITAASLLVPDQGAGFAARDKVRRLVAYGERLRRRTGLVPVWFPDALEFIRRENLSLPDSNGRPLQAITSQSSDSLSADLLEKLACLAERAYFVGEPNRDRQPTSLHTGLRIVPHEFKVSDQLALILGDFESGLALAFKGSSRLNARSLKEVAETNRAWYRGEMIAPAAGLPGKVNREFQAEMYLLWPRAIPRLAHAAGEIYLVGHGKGGALATLAALRVRELLPEAKIRVVTFGAPPAGDAEFSAYYHTVIPDHWRYELEDDIVPHMPLDPLASKLILPGATAASLFLNSRYAHVGRLRYFDGSRWTTDEAAGALERQRRFRLFSLLVATNSRKTLSDHSLDESYLPRLRFP